MTSVDGLRVRLGPLLLLWGEPQQHIRETTIRRGDSTTHAPRTRDRRTSCGRADNAGEGGVEHARDLEEDSPATLEVC